MTTSSRRILSVATDDRRARWATRLAVLVLLSDPNAWVVPAAAHAHSSPSPSLPAAASPPGEADPGRIGVPFVLTDEDGERFDSSRLRGAPFALFFGFTRCADVCPLALTRLMAALGELGEPARAIPIVFITVDPEHDTPTVLSNYLADARPRVIGLTGTPEAIASVGRGFKVMAERAELGDGYTVQHTPYVYLMDGKGELADLLDPEADEAVLKSQLGALIARP